MNDEMRKESLSKYIDEVVGSLNIMKKEHLNILVNIMKVLDDARHSGKNIYIMGNGGSASTASHMSSDMNKGAMVEGKPRFKAISLADNIPVMLAWGNDSSYEDIFVEQLKNFLKEGDIVIGISGSGNSKNVLKAIDYANKNGAKTIGFTGFEGGKLKELAQIDLVVPNHLMQQIEDIHLLIEHAITYTFSGEK